VTAACDAWNSLVADPARITSIVTHQWATITLDLPRFSGEALAHLAACFSKRAGLVKLRAEWRRTGL
jgi:hypothetical protein